MQTALKSDLSPQITILVVDDSRTIRASLKKTLQNEFYIVEAVDGEDAWKKLQEDPSIGLVITDIMMPELDGYGLICRIRGANEPRFQRIPIIVVTSAEDEIYRQRAHACGANNFIVKPPKPQDLLERVHFHTEAHLDEKPQTAPQMEKYGESVENAVIQAPTIAIALELLKSHNTATLAPYAAELALEVLPLLEFCDEAFGLGVESNIASIKDKLTST